MVDFIKFMEKCVREYGDIFEVKLNYLMNGIY